MFITSFGIITRILSNSYLNVFQKILTNKGEKSSVINFYTYLGLSIIGLFFLKTFNTTIMPLVLLMGCLGCLGNYFIIKALSIGELSTLAPINSYKPIVALIFGILFLKEYPTKLALTGIILIIFGTLFIFNTNKKANTKAILLRILALIFSGSEAIVIKKIIIATNSSTAFILWCFAGLFFSLLFVLFSKHKLIIKDYKHQIFLILTVGIMQYSTNFVFERMNVCYALALFQLSTLLSIFLGANIFNEKNIKQKVIGSIIMIIGAIFIIIN